MRDAIKSEPPVCGLIDLTRYPIDRLHGAPIKDVVARCRSNLAAHGCSVLPGFFAPGLDSMQREAARLAPQAYLEERCGNPYSSPDDPSLPASHPVRIFLKRTQGFVAGDQLPEVGCLKRIYRDPCFRTFIAMCLGLDMLHEYADPLGCLVVNVIRDAAEHPWHFDTGEFVVSTLVQTPEDGGEFEYCPNIRSPEQENFDRVGRVIRGEDRSEVRTLRLRAGDMQLFLGRYALHRVAPVKGRRPRLSVIFSYARRPGMIATAERSRLLFGRTADCHALDRSAAGRADTLID